jgi:hypothetical protein
MRDAPHSEFSLFIVGKVTPAQIDLRPPCPRDFKRQNAIEGWDSD